MPRMPGIEVILYHWSPRSRLKQIKRQGLMPNKRNVRGPTYNNPDKPLKGGEFRQSAVCFSLDPATAWAYSHAVFGIEGTYDLWAVKTIGSDYVQQRKEDGKVVEVRIHNRIPKSRLVWIGERTQ